MKCVSICSTIMALMIMINTVLCGQNEKANSGKVIASAHKIAEIETSHDVKNITFDFPNTQLSVFAEFVAKLCGKILIGEKLLKGNIDIKSQTKLSLKEVKELFKAVLYAKKMTFAENDIYMEIIQRSDSIVKVYKINYLKAADLAKSLSEMFRMSFSVGNQPVNIQIVSIDEANAVMVLAPKNQQMEIEKSIKKMDIRVSQVMLNIMVLEVSKTSGFGFGLDVNFNDGTYNTGISSGGTAVTGTPPAISPMTFTTKGIASAGGVAYNKGNWMIDVQAVENNTRLNILTQPKILAADNQKAEISLGKKEPYVKTSVSIGGTTGNSTTSSSISTDDIGLDIVITPRINSVNDVTLELKLKITSKITDLSVISGNKGENDPNINKVPQIGHRIINNTSNVKNGEVLVLGGLLKNRKVTTTTAPPVVGNIPWIGWMFSKVSEATEQTELMVFISPTVVYDLEGSEELTKMETNKLRNYDLQTKGTIDQMLTGKKDLNDDVFNVFDYFTDGKYRSEQDFIAQPGSL
jgi:type II secretory pathway component GspD/PulD (secretin)